MKRIAGHIIIAGALVLLSGCATKQFVPLPDQSKEIENPSMGRIYVMRPTEFGGGVSMRIDDGDKHIGKTGPGGYLCWEREPGNTEIRGIAENTDILPLTVKQGETYYVGQHVVMGILFARNRLRLMDTAEGKEKLKGCGTPTLVLDK